MWAAALASTLVLQHVPIYGTHGNHHGNCVHPPHSHRTSQAVYLIGPGGLEVDPSGFRDGETIDVDAVFRDEVDERTYDLHVGCGGCHDADLPRTPPLPKRGYLAPEIEPFTQTWYRSANMSRTFDVSRLNRSECRRFSIRLVGRGNESDGIRWAAVVGLGEAFTASELLGFPVFVIRNHGPAWNDLGYTLWLWTFLGVPLAVVAVLVLGRRPPRTLRDCLYLASAFGFAVAAFEELTHLVYAQSRVGTVPTYGFYVGLFVVVGLSNGVGVVLVALGARGCTRRGLVEIVGGVLLLFLFGSGFYVGPAFLTLAGLARLRESCLASAPIPLEAAPRSARPSLRAREASLRRAKASR